MIMIFVLRYRADGLDSSSEVQIVVSALYLVVGHHVIHHMHSHQVSFANVISIPGQLAFGQ